MSKNSNITFYNAKNVIISKLGVFAADRQRNVDLSIETRHLAGLLVQKYGNGLHDALQAIYEVDNDSNIIQKAIDYEVERIDPTWKENARKLLVNQTIGRHNKSIADVNVNKRIADFLNATGIPTQSVSHTSGFISRVAIVNGELRFDDHSSFRDLLHEAGHITITPRRWRSIVFGDITKAQHIMCNDTPDLDLENRLVLSRHAV